MLDGANKSKALLYGGGIFAAIVLILVFRRLTGGASTVSTVSTGVDPATLQAQTSLALAQIGAATSAQQTNAQMVVAQEQAQNDLAKHTIDANVARYSIDAQTHQVDVQTAASTASDARNANLQASVAKWTLEQAAQVNANNNAFQITYAANANASTEALAQIQAATVHDQITSNEHVTVANLAAQTSQINSYLGAQASLTDSNNAKDIAIANINRPQHKSPFWSSIVGIAGIFSDRRLKSDVVLLGLERDGLGVYSYRYSDDKSYQIGVMADEVKRLRPHAMGRKVGGFDTVRYSAL